MVAAGRRDCLGGGPAGLGLGLWRMLERPHPKARRGVMMAVAIAAGGILIPIVLVPLGADYLAPRNLVAAMIPVTAVTAVVVVWPGTGRTGIALAAGGGLEVLDATREVCASQR